MFNRKKWNGKVKHRRPVSLRAILLIPFVLQIAGAVALTGYLSLRNGQQSVNQVASRLRNEYSNRINQHLESYLVSARHLSQMNGTAMELGLLNPKDLDGLGHLFWRQMQIYDAGYINFVADDDFVAAGRFYPNSPITIDLMSPRKYGTKDVYSYTTDQVGNRLRSQTVVQNYDFKRERWYQATVKAGKPTWTLFQWEVEPYYLSLAASYPVYDAKRNLVGISWTEQRLWEISQFLQRLNVSSTGGTFIIERNGLLIASSTRDEPFAMVNGRPKRLSASESQDQLIRSTVNYLQQHFAGLDQIQKAEQVDFQSNGERQFVQVTPWQDVWGIDWLIVVVMPESDFMGQINAYTRTTILLCLGALALATLLGLYTSRWIAKPLLQLNQVSKAIAAGQLDQSVNESNRVGEIGELAKSFNQMAQQLRASFGALEQANRELEQANEELETRVHARTEELFSALQDLRRTQAQLVQTEKMSSLGQMIAGIAHEINNPVNFIHGNLNHARDYIRDLLAAVQLYQKHYPSPDAEIVQHSEDVDLDFLTGDLPKLLDSMQEGTRRIREIVLSLRNFSRLDEAEKKHADIHEGIDSTLLILEHRLKPKLDRPGIEVIKQYGQLPLVECYPGPLNQVFMNIFANAIDALEPCLQFTSSVSRPATLTITTSTVQDQVWICIADNGMGMTEATRSKLFDPFFTTKPVGQGTGLGLSISYQIVTEQHHGSLSCTSAPGEGTEFVIAIPIRQLPNLN
ncbi:HAMP domain-containing protein [Leptolyngbya sp. NK1-12]|uniref:histidine kinase n=1 Tax=Leptolyngbya sp. NK1-12 TaxID=2547451 RepID=A0AA96WWZ5_9CYAN|nr:HAMP domain-containing protein [Leptolyngbya sp. NK1-12]